MTDPQLANNNNNTSTNNNNDGEPKYLHKKFKKMATTEVVAPVEVKKEAPTSETGITGPSKRRDSLKDNPKDSKESSRADDRPPQESNEVEPAETKKAGYACPYCKLSCAKPSVLQKHIRAHTNERPYPCVPCGFAFKTKSNLYKHCRSRAHALKMEGGDPGKVSEDSDVSLSDSASNGTGTPPPPATSTVSSTVQNTKTVKSGKIYKPKFHTALQSVNQETESTPPSPPTMQNGTTAVKPNAEQLQEHIDKIITDNQAIVDAIDPRLHKLMQRQQSLVEQPKTGDQPLNLSSGEESQTRKRCYNESFAQEKVQESGKVPDDSIIKDLLLKNKIGNELQDESFTCQSCKIAYTSADNLEAHRRYYCKGLEAKRDFQLDLDKKDDIDSKSDFYSTVQPLPSPGPLLGNTRLVDAYAPPPKKLKPEIIPTTLRSLEELSKYPRPNSLQMFGGEVRILDNSGETKTMRIEPRQTNSPPSDHSISPKCVTSETSSIVVRSGLHSGGTMVHKPPGTPASSSQSPTITLANTPKLLAPIIPNISTPNIAPTMTYTYLEPHLNPLTNITAYNPLTLPQAGIASILHGGKVIPYVPGMPGPHTLSTTAVDISPAQSSGAAGYKVIPGIPGLHMISQPLDLASPIRVQTPSIPGIPGPTSNAQGTLGQPLDLASPAKDIKIGFKNPNNGLLSPKIPAKLEEKFRNRPPSNPIVEISKNELDRHPKNLGKYKILDKSGKTEKVFNFSNDVDSQAAYSPRSSPKTLESRKRPASWMSEEGRPLESPRSSPSAKYESSPPPPTPPQENSKMKSNSPQPKSIEPFQIMGHSESDKGTTVITIIPEVPKLGPNKASSDELFEKLQILVTAAEEINPKFRRPTTLPLKPGTFTPKRHHGITPNANTLPLISPETPRPKKSYGQLYLNGHAYTYLGMKCSTKATYCTLNRPQPMYVIQQHLLSMYSNWKICNEFPADLVNLRLYDSRHRPAAYSIAGKKSEDILTHSSQRPTTPSSPDSGLESDTQEKTRRVKIFDGGFESNEDYTYVRGRGRGRYVCEECGIRCKKPSMLKKHIRTHTDVRPYTCKHCSFSFKTKGNLTKHMKSKAHYKKCVELGVNPVPTSVCDDNIDKEAIAKLVAGGANAEESSDEEEDSDGDDSDESGSEEQEAAQSLLSLSQTSAKRLPGLLPSGRPTTYPYALTFPTTSVTNSLVSTMASTTSPATTTATSTTVIHSDDSYRYYVLPNRFAPEEIRDSVIRSSKVEEVDVEMEVEISKTQPAPQPIDLTTKSPQLVMPKPSKHVDILTPVSEPGMMQAIVHTMERLPLQGREWKPDAEGHMLQAYLTERHMMDSKMKQQFRVGSFKSDKKHVTYSKPEIGGCRSAFSPSTATLTWTSMRVNAVVADNRDKSDEMKLETRAERRPFDIESLHPEKEEEVRIVSTSEHPQAITKSLERPTFALELRQSPQVMKNEFGLTIPQERMVEVIQPMPMNPESRSYERPMSHEFKLPATDLRQTPELKDQGNTERSPSRDRVEHNPEHRAQGFEMPSHEHGKSHEIPRIVEVRSGERPEVKINEIGKTNGDTMKYGVPRKVVVGGPEFRSPSPSTGGKPQAEFLQPSGGPGANYSSVNEEGRSVCGFCSKVFNRPSHLRLHINIHYFERRFRCESCAVSFRTKGHLTKHERSVSHHNKVSMTSTFGAATTSNPRPFKCTDCKIAFRIHGHLAKHLRSKMHIMKLECIGKLPFGTYAEMERSGVNLNDIDTTDCDNSLTSLQTLAYKLYEKDPSKMGQWDPEMAPPQITSGGETSSDEGEPIPSHAIHQYPPASEIEASPRAYHMSANLAAKNQPKQPTIDHHHHHVPNNHYDDNSHPYKCQMCQRTLRSVDELQVHCYVEHNGDRGKENNQKRMGDETLLAREDQISRRKSTDDT